MFDEALTPQQLQVINALTEGITMTDAAALAGVHRNTIANWRRNSLFFREALADAQYDRALLFRDMAEGMLDLAFATLNTLLIDPKASPSVRLKAAMFIIEKATTPPAPKKPVPFDFSNVPVTKTPPLAQPVQEVHKDAQPQPAPAIQTVRRETPKVGRNEPCPCGSGQKYKRCCLNKPSANSQAEAA